MIGPLNKLLPALLAMLVMCAVPLHAAEAQQASDARRTGARTHFERGRALQEVGDYPGAILEYEIAYQLVPLPGFLFNIAQCHRLQGHKHEAIRYYERYIQDGPPGKGRTEALNHVEKLRQELEAERAAAPPAAAPAPVEPAPVPATRPREPDAPLGAARITGISLMGAGVLSTFVGGYFSYRVIDLERDAPIGPDDNWPRDLWEKGERAERWSVLFYVAAGVLVTGGATTYLLAPHPRVSVSPSIGSDRAGLMLETSF